MTLPIPSRIQLNKKKLRQLGWAMKRFYNMSGKDTPDEMLDLLIMAKKNLKGINIEFRKHRAAELEPDVKNLIGYFPSGEFQILFKKDKRMVSCIRGAVSFGFYEICEIEGDKTKGDPERFNDPKDVIKRIRAILK